jgi:hypothetical protein
VQLVGGKIFKPLAGDPGRLTNTHLILFPFSFSFFMYFLVILCRLASPYMSPRRLEGGCHLALWSVHSNLTARIRIERSAICLPCRLGKGVAKSD